MIFQCPITGVTWGTSVPSKLKLTLRVAHPVLSLTLPEIHKVVTSWEELTDSDKQLLWAATLCNTSLLHSVRGKALRPTAAIVEATFSELLQVVTWAATQKEPLEILPQFVPETPACGNTRGWLDACRSAKRDWQESQDSWAEELAEREETGKMDRALRMFQAAYSIEPDKLNAKLAHWLLVASDVPTTSYALWKAILCGTGEQLVMHRALTVADMDECLEWFQVWEHPTLLRLFAIRQITAKTVYLNKHSLEGEATLDFLLDPPKPGAAFELLSTEAKATVLLEKQANLADLARARLAAIKAGKLS